MSWKNFLIVGLLISTIACKQSQQAPAAIVIQTDFGVKDGAVSEMKGVAFEVDNHLPVFDLTHEIPAYNIWEAAYRLNQTVPYWPKGTVFVSVVDPGVGTDRKSVVAETNDGHYIVTPDNGSLTLLADKIGIKELREIDEKINRRAGSGDSYTFHGRDVYVYTAARLAAGKISFSEVGPKLDRMVVKFDYQKAELSENRLKGNIPVLDPQYGNVWTNIPDSLIRKAGIQKGDSIEALITLKRRITLRDSVVYAGTVLFVNTFGDVPEGKPLAYINSLMNFSLALNMGDFARTHHIGNGPDWTIEIRRPKSR